MIKVIALATASVQTTPTRWFCLLSDYCKHTYLSFLDVVLCSVLTFLHKLYVETLSFSEELSECTLLLARISKSNVMLYHLGSVTKLIDFVTKC